MLITLHFPLIQVTSQVSNVNCASSQAFRAIHRNIALNVAQVLEVRKGEVHRLPVFTSRKKALVSSMGDKNKILPILIGTCVIRGCLHDRTRTGASFARWWLFDFLSRLREGTPHVYKLLAWIQIANIASITDTFLTVAARISAINLLKFFTNLTLSKLIARRNKLTRLSLLETQHWRALEVHVPYPIQPPERRI